MVQAPIKIQMHIFYIYSKVNKVNLSAHTLHLPLSWWVNSFAHI